MTSYDPSTGGNYPLMKMPGQKPETSDFEKKCQDLEDRIREVYSFFMWYGSINKNPSDELRSIIFLEGIFLQMLVDIREIYMMRGKKLYNECTEKFKNLLSLLNEKMFRGTKYIRKSNMFLTEPLNSDTSCIVAMRQDIIKGFRNQSEWLRKELDSHENREHAERLADELGLNYEMEKFGCMGDDFKQHANMVFNGLMLLSFPSMPDVPCDTYCELFDNSMDELQSNSSWKNSFDSWKWRIEKEYDLHDIEENKDKVVYLKKLWAALDSKEENLMRGFGIIADNTRSDSERATMGYRIYHNLNMNIGEEYPRMGTSDIQQYLLYVIQKRFLDSEIDSLKPLPPGIDTQKPSKRGKRRLFKLAVDTTMMADCFKEVYRRFYIDDNNRVILQGHYNDSLALMAHLFILCESEGYFENSYRMHFFKFCTAEALFQTEKTPRTFHNYLDYFEPLYKTICLKANHEEVEKETNDDFQKVLNIFHGTPKFEKMRHHFISRQQSYR